MIFYHNGSVLLRIPTEGHRDVCMLPATVFLFFFLLSILLFRSRRSYISLFAADALVGNRALSK